MIYIFFTVTIVPSKDIWGPIDRAQRVGRYMRCIGESLNFLKGTEDSIKRVIIINDRDITESELDKFKEPQYHCDILYSNNNPTNIFHKGQGELDAVNYALNYYNVKDEDMVIKQTGRYLPCDPCPYWFYHEVMGKVNDFDMFGKFCDTATEEESNDVCILGFFALRAKYLKKFQYKYAAVHGFSCAREDVAEVEFALYINKYLNPDRIYRAPFLYVEIVPANDPDRTCYM